MRYSRKSNNYTILRNLISKSRSYNLPDEIDYIIIYTFLYKHCSDNLKDYLSAFIDDVELTFDEAYKDLKYQKIFQKEALDAFGFYILMRDDYFDEVINNYYSDRFFLSDFFKRFQEGIIFDDKYPDKDYFEFLFKTISQNVNPDKYEFDSEVNLALKEIIFSISKLDAFEYGISLCQAFEVLSSSRMMRINSSPDYISQVFSSIVSCEKSSIKTAYDPFIKDGTSLIKLANNFNHGVNYYGKEADTLTYCYTLSRFLLNYFNLNNVFLKNEDATESIDIDGASFDVILSNIPINIKNYYSSNEKQSFEMSKRNRRSQIREAVLENIEMDSDSFSEDSELNDALENLLEKISSNEVSNIEFGGEYESLKDNEFLFLINLIESLNDDGMMLINISRNFLFKNSLETLRKYLIHEKNYIDTIISIPEEVGRRRPEVIIVFKKNRASDDILFIDISKQYKTKRKEILIAGLFRRNLIFDNETIAKLQDIYLKRLSINKLSNLIRIDEIEDNDFNLSVSRYVDTFEGKFIRLNDLIYEKREIDSNIDDLNLKIERMMNELNIRFK